MASVYEQIGKIRLVPVVKIEDAEKALPLAEALRKGGLPCAEITFRTSCAAQAIQLIAQAFPDMLIGAGTVLSPEQAEQAVKAGARFIVSPGFNSEVVRWCIERSVPVIPGCATPSEVEAAMRLGLRVVKFFPAEQAGGSGMINALSAPYGDMRFMPTGGINEQNILAYLANPKVLACGGSWMVREDFIRAGDFGRIERLCHRAGALIRGGKNMEPSSAVSLPGLEADRPMQVLAFGEPLLRLSSEGMERISTGERLIKYAGGAELNVAAGLSRFGLRAGFLSKLPANPLGEYIRAAALQKGVNGRYLLDDPSPGARVGLYFTERGGAPRRATVVYDRKGSSFTTFAPADVPEEALSKTQLFYTSGISLACSAHTAEILKAFKEAGSIVAFDVNYRANLWGENEAREAITKLLPFVDILFISEESSHRMFHKTGDLRDILHSFSAEYGISVVASTRRTVQSTRTQSFCSLLYGSAQNAFFEEAPYENIEVADRIGSGDAFVAGVLYGLLVRRDFRSAVAYGDAACAAKCTTEGDMPGVGAAELETIVREHLSGTVPGEMNR